MWLIYEPRTPIISYGLFKKWGIDAIESLPKTSSRNEYIIVADIGKFIYDFVCCRLGIPLEIVSHHRSGFRSHVLNDLLNRLNIRHIYSIPYYRQYNGLVENTNGIICKIISKQVKKHPKEWDKHLTTALWTYGTSYKASLGFTPFHLVYGQEALLPIEVEIPSLRVLIKESGQSEQEVIQRRLIDLQELSMKRELAIEHYINQAEKRRQEFNRQLKDKGLTEGTLFQPRWEGPSLIKTKFKNGSYQLMDLSWKVHKTKVNGRRLKKYWQRIEDIDEEQEQPKEKEISMVVQEDDPPWDINKLFERYRHECL
ncbi:hypothetical protein KP509_36G045800 [Ceratopteris richardii]|uniref:Integrase catalytic domain-containing protein n=1 Tax=Ceratopteris richardii TaxID=49495 RepID=A0A8T2QC35_CERRI|nr:hypothetical protein KP509_36G045800 [Ceratopteris richardii]